MLRISVTYHHLCYHTWPHYISSSISSMTITVAPYNQYDCCSLTNTKTNVLT